MENNLSSLPGFDNGLPGEIVKEKTARNARGVFMEMRTWVKKSLVVLGLVAMASIGCDAAKRKSFRRNSWL